MKTTIIIGLKGGAETSIMSKKKHKIKKSDITAGVVLAANSEMLDRLSEAGRQHAVAYNGVDNATGSILKKGLKDISKSKVHPDYQDINIRQQAGFSAEVKTVARENAEKIIGISKVRAARTDDMQTQPDGKGYTVGGANEQLYDVADVDTNDNYVLTTGRQLKFVGGSPQECADKLLSPKFDKYRNADVSMEVPSDFYEDVKKEFAKKAAALKKKIRYAEQQGNEELAAKHKLVLERIEKTDDDLRKGNVSSRAAIEARLSPAISTAKDIGIISHRAGIEAAKIGATVGGGISVITNTVAVLRGEKKAKDAIIDAFGDTVKAGTTSYTVGFTNTALASVMKNSPNALIRSLGKANAPAYIISTAISTIKSLARLCKDEININEFFLEIGKSGTNLLTSAQGAIIGQVLIPIPVIGALVGGLVSTLICDVIYDATLGMKSLNAEIDAFSDKIYEEIAVLKEYQIRLMELDLGKFEKETGKYNEVVKLFSKNYSEQDFNTMLKLTYDYIGIPCPWGNGSFDDFMNDKRKTLMFG